MKSVIYIDRNSLSYYGGNVHTAINFPFPKEVVADLEVVNETELAKQIGEWIKTHKIEPTNALILLAPASYFQKEVPANTPPDKVEEVKKNFIDNVPFNDTLIHEFVFGKSTIQVVINKNFVYAIRDIFQANNFKIDAIAPATEVYGLQPLSGFTPQVAQDALKKITNANNFPVVEIEEQTEEQKNDAPPPEQKNTRLYIMLGVFGVLILALVVVFMMSRQSGKKKVVAISPEPLPTRAQAQPVASTAATLQPTQEASAAASIAKDELTIEVLNGSGVAGQADEIRKLLEEKDFDNIETGNAPTVQSAKTLVVFKPGVGEKERKEIITIVEFYVETVTVQEKSDIESDVLITTSSPTTTIAP